MIFKVKRKPFDNISDSVRNELIFVNNRNGSILKCQKITLSVLSVKSRYFRITARA